MYLTLSFFFFTGVDDAYQHGRGVALADFNRDGKVDIVYGNWNGPHRLFLQMSTNGKVRFRVIIFSKLSCVNGYFYSVSS